jgi:hypothetical protein
MRLHFLWGLVTLIAFASSGCSHTQTYEHEQSISSTEHSCPYKNKHDYLGKFNLKKDLLIANFDSKPDPDDIMSVAALGTMLADPRFAKVNYIAVAGAYGTQAGVFIDAPTLFNLAFKGNWLSAHSDRAGAIEKVTARALVVLEKDGDIWIQEAGQSDVSADIVRAIKIKMPTLDTKERIHTVQHSTWNEQATSPDDLLYVRDYTHYSKIPDGNMMGNGTPGFNTAIGVHWDALIAHPRLGPLWKEAREVSLRTNGKGGYDNKNIGAGGFDFSDASENTWIFGFNYLVGVDDFFAEFVFPKK